MRKENKALIWNEGDEKYYPNGVDDEDYCVLEFQTDHGRYYRYGGIGDISANELAELCRNAGFRPMQVGFSMRTAYRLAGRVADRGLWVRIAIISKSYLVGNMV